MRDTWTGGPAAVALALLLGACSVFGGKAAEEPPYRLVLKDGAVELRDYEGFAVAWTTVEGTFDEAVGTGFRRLFRYITGSNRRASEIEMTAPVLTEPRAAATGATVVVEPRRSVESGAAPRLAGAGIGAWSTGFILPAGYTRESAPAPTSGDIVLVDVASRCVASIRFGGGLDDEAAERARRTLARWIEKRGFDHAGDWQAAGYNPPWTIPALRRNEVLVTLRSC